MAGSRGTGTVVSVRADGPLVVSALNPRYFAIATDSGERVVYLTGSHVNNNFHDGLGFGPECAPEPERFDFDAYLAFLDAHGHNFIRLWRWEQFQGYLGPADVHFCMTPQPWARVGSGEAKDGKPRFDLSQFDEAYFERLRDRVVAAGARGIYVSVMFFEGFSLHLTTVPDNVEGHPFHVRNNVNDVAISSIIDYQVLPLDPQIRALQETYIRKVVDTVHDLPNVLYEVANESSGMDAESVQMPDGTAIDTPIGDTTQWQYWVIDTVKDYERSRGYDPHPIGMTFLYPVPDQHAANDPLWASPADFVSPGFDDAEMPGDSRWLSDPPANDGTKVVISDNDHYSPFAVDALWAWKCMLRGQNPIIYDLGIVAGIDPDPPPPGTPPYAALEPARYAAGDTRAFAERVDLAHMEPRGQLASTAYALANPGVEYLVLQPDDDAEFTVTLEPGTYTASWYAVTTRATLDADDVTVDATSPVTFRHPFDAPTPAVLHLVPAHGNEPASTNGV
jgi:hypothetical protein